MNNKKNKVLVIGLDGATFDVIKPNLNKLPNLEKLMGCGSYGDLQSTNPPVTCPAWPSFATGKKPENHNTFDFMKLDKKKGDIQLANYHMVKSRKIWEIASEYHKRVCVLEIPITYPVKEINGVMIAGYPSPNSSDKCYPIDSIEQIKKEVGAFYDLMPGNFKEGNEIEILERYKNTARNRGEIVSHLWRKEDWDLFLVNFHLTDICSHYFWHTHDPTHPKYNGEMDDIVLSGYKLMDKIVGDIISEVDENTYIFIISDHGHGKLLKFVNLNIFLLDKGYIKLRNDLKTKSKYFLFRNGLTPSKVYSIIKKLGLQNRVTGYGRNTRDQLLNKFLSFSDIDWKKTKAYSFGHIGQIYINVKNENGFGAVQRGKEYKETLEKLVKDIKKLEDPDTEEPVVERIFKKDELYSGKYRDNAPDLVLRMKNYEYISYPLFAANHNIFIDPLNDHTGSHRINGIFIVEGTQIEPGKEQKDMEIIDVAPTILHILNIPVPKDMDGKVLNDIFKEGSDLAKKRIKTQEINEKENIRSGIRKLKAEGNI